MEIHPLYLVELILLLLCFPAVAVYTYMRHRRMRSQGTPVAEFADEHDLQQVVLGGSFDISRKKVWCRVRITWQLQAERVPAGADCHRYTVVLTGDQGRELFREERSMSDFFDCCWPADRQHRQGGAHLYQGDAVLVEFLAPAAGTYGLRFSLSAREEGSRMTAVCLHIKEKVLPHKGRNKIHTTVDVRKIKPASEKDDPSGEQSAPR